MYDSDNAFYKTRGVKKDNDCVLCPRKKSFCRLYSFPSNSRHIHFRATKEHSQGADKGFE